MISLHYTIDTVEAQLQVGPSGSIIIMVISVKTEQGLKPWARFSLQLPIGPTGRAFVAHFGLDEDCLNWVQSASVTHPTRNFVQQLAS
jgi:hypothetical protein